MNAAPSGSQAINTGNRTYIISQLTAGTWTASTSGTAEVMSIQTRTSLLAAIEKTSGCKVTDSDITRQGLQLDAQVDCGNRMKN